VRRVDKLIAFMCRMSWNLGSLNLLETSGPVQAINGNALTFFFPLNLTLGTSTYTDTLYRPTYKRGSRPITQQRSVAELPTDKLCGKNHEKGNMSVKVLVEQFIYT